MALKSFLLTLTLRRLATLVCGIILLISGLGTMTYWALKWSGNETFGALVRARHARTFSKESSRIGAVPFGLSTFRSLQWPLLDMFLLKQCAVGSALLVADHAYAPKVSIAVGLLFASMGVLGLAIDSMPQWREELVGTVDELQPMFLNIWFLGFGGVLAALGAGGFAALDKFKAGVPIVRWLPFVPQQYQTLTMA